VNDVLMPVVSLCTGGVDFTNLFVKLSGEGDFNTLAEAQEAGASVMAYGQFIQNIVDFLIVAFCIFLMIKGMNKLNKKKEEEPAPAPEPPAPSKEETLLTEIRDLLKNK
jgi:large conductance mechanosensitive channel